MIAAPLRSGWPARSACLRILRAQASYPDQPINLIVPVAAGGPTNAIARIYAEFLSRDFVPLIRQAGLTIE
ncbi:hypothetical protein IVA95_01510 [Bradyrhizobium sp. 157]|uniref:hypothetical protein n=1 Tax=Bradyrhizobium sp. 157 TaxID=2782631 RepID=UPI001FF9767B|nr:hypothetical protein [Bradyrhizobium sp. 157]MCK1636294.1 hypothetical protein [Bradyrhizobium sp. 157]